MKRSAYLICHLSQQITDANPALCGYKPKNHNIEVVEGEENQMIDDVEYRLNEGYMLVTAHSMETWFDARINELNKALAKAKGDIIRINTELEALKPAAKSIAEQVKEIFKPFDKWHNEDNEGHYGDLD